jgi:hypothetical protein
MTQVQALHAASHADDGQNGKGKSVTWTITQVRTDVPLPVRKTVRKPHPLEEKLGALQLHDSFDVEGPEFQTVKQRVFSIRKKLGLPGHTFHVAPIGPQHTRIWRKKA